MSRLITAKIDVKKIVKALLFEGKKGTYLDLIIWVNDKPDKYGNDISIQQRTGKDDPKIYIGEGKFYVKKEDPLPDKQGQYQKVDAKTSNPDDLPVTPDEEMTDLPFN